MRQTTCAQRIRSPCFLLKAKGRTAPVSFGNGEFKKWRKQFERVIVKDGSGALNSVKVTSSRRVATQTDSPRVKSKLLARGPSFAGRPAATRSARPRLSSDSYPLFRHSRKDQATDPISSLVTASLCPTRSSSPQLYGNLWHSHCWASVLSAAIFPVAVARCL